MTALSHDPIEEALRRPRRYWDVDGIPEIAIGFFWLLWGAIVILPIAVPQLAKARNLISILGIFSAPLLMDAGVRKWKERVTFPRTGYVELRPPRRSLRLTLVLIAAVLAAAVVLLVRFGGHHVLPHWLGAALGVLISLTLLQLAWRLRSLRLAALSCLVAAVGIATTVFGLSRDASTILVFVATGGVCVLDGALRMRSFVRAHPLRPEEEA